MRGQRTCRRALPNQLPILRRFCFVDGFNRSSRKEMGDHCFFICGWECDRLRAEFLWGAKFCWDADVTVVVRRVERVSDDFEFWRNPDSTFFKEVNFSGCSSSITIASSYLVNIKTSALTIFWFVRSKAWLACFKLKPIAANSTTNGLEVNSSLDSEAASWANSKSDDLLRALTIE